MKKPRRFRVKNVALLVGLGIPRIILLRHILCNFSFFSIVTKAISIINLNLLKKKSRFSGMFFWYKFSITLNEIFPVK